jgi:hypothetical protein
MTWNFIQGGDNDNDKFVYCLIYFICIERIKDKIFGLDSKEARDRGHTEVSRSMVSKNHDTTTKKKSISKQDVKQHVNR